jgi:hypothetical protein
MRRGWSEELGVNIRWLYVQAWKVSIVRWVVGYKDKAV